MSRSVGLQEIDHYLFLRIGEMALLESGYDQVLQFPKHPFSVFVTNGACRYNVVMTIQDKLLRNIKSLTDLPQNSWSTIESGLDVMFEIQLIEPIGAAQMVSKNAYVWAASDGVLSVEWQVIRGSASG